MEKKQESILEWYQKQGKYIDAPCSGRGKCGRCKIQFFANPPEPERQEKVHLSTKELENGIRLACMTKKTEREDFVFVDDIFLEGFSVTEFKREILENAQDRNFGIALDIGTTTIAMRLVGIKTGNSYGTWTSVNHQRTYGADVISRITQANRGKLHEMQRCIQKDICELLVRIISDSQISVSYIKKIVIAGNTTMCHILLGYDCEGLGQAPFKPVEIGMTKITVLKLFEALEAEVKGRLLDLCAEVIILPGVSAFIGADITAGIYACDMDLRESQQMLIDVGTNGEMVIGNAEGFLALSTAAGPVFEGGNISCGMPAVKGAVSHIRKGSCEVIGNVKPQGICGSGIVELAAYLLQEQLIDENGTLCENYFEDGYPIGVGEKEEAWLRLRQEDIRELQMGKAAIRAGIEILTQKQKVEKIFLAGGFGTAIDIVSACYIDMFPQSFCERIMTAGNTALEGAQKFLFDPEGEKRIRHIIESTKEIVLANEMNFIETYIQFMQFLI